MTTSEANRLDLQKAFRFVMYYGEEKIGFLFPSGVFEKFVFVKNSFIQEYNSGNNGVAEDIDIRSIYKYEQYNSYSTSPRYFNQKEEIIIRSGAKKLVIIGAGASYDFVYDTEISKEFHPPLANQLFNDNYDYVLNKYPGAEVLASEILNFENVELFFQQQWQLIKNHFAPAVLNQIINTQFYFQELLKTISGNVAAYKRNNYTALMQMLSRYCIKSDRQVIITSFNYDTILEKSIKAVFKHEFSKIEDYINPEHKVLVFKPHGSCNWVRYFRSNNLLNFNLPPETLFSKDLYDKGINYAEIFQSIDAHISIEENPILIHNRSSTVRPFLPQLLIPYTDKDEFVMPDHHRKSLESNLDNIEEILIIGWKGTENLFKELIKKKLGHKKIKIIAVSNNDPTIEKELSPLIKDITWEFHSTFSEFIKSISKAGHSFFD